MPSDEQITGISPDAALRQLLSDAIKRSGKSRPQIAEEMARVLSVRVTEAMLNDFTSPRKSAARFPAAFVRAFCEAVGSNRLQRLLLDEQSLQLIEVGEHVVGCRRTLERAQELVEQISAPRKRQNR